MNYKLYPDKEGIKSYTVKGTCKSCLAKKNFYQAELKINSLELITTPLRICENPNLKYDIEEYFGFFSRSEMNSLVEYLNDHSNSKTNLISRSKVNNESELLYYLEYISVYDKFIQKVDYHYIILSIEKFNKIIDYNWISKEFENFWMQNEVIIILSPRGVDFIKKEIKSNEENSIKTGEEYWIYYSKTFIKNNKVFTKSDEFLKIVSILKEYLKINSVSFRGHKYKDSQNEYFRLFGEKNSHKKMKFHRSFSLKPSQ